MELVPRNDFDFAGLFPALLERGEEMRPGAGRILVRHRHAPPISRPLLDALTKAQAARPAARARLEGQPEGAKALGKGPECGATCPLPGQGRLMRALSETMMEAGAALDDGISL